MNAPIHFHQHHFTAVTSYCIISKLFIYRNSSKFMLK